MKGKVFMRDNDKLQVLRVFTVPEILDMIPTVQYTGTSFGKPSPKGAHVILDGMKVSFRRILKHAEHDWVQRITPEDDFRYYLYRVVSDGSLHLDLYQGDHRITLENFKPRKTNENMDS